MTTRTPDDSMPRDPRFDAAWRNASSEEPSGAIDAAIRAAARREVGAKPQSLASQAAMQARRRWRPLAAAAAVAVIAIGVVQRAGHDEFVVSPSGNSIVSDMPAQSAKSDAESRQIAREAPAPQSRADGTPSTAAAASEERARADATPSSQRTRNAQSAGRPDARGDAQRSVAQSAPAPSEKKKEAAANSAPALPEPFPAAAPRSAATAERDASSAAPAPANVGNLAGGASPAMPSVADSAPAMSAAPASPPSAPQSIMPPPASFAEGSRTSASAPMRAAPLAKTAPAIAANDARIKDRAPLPVADWIALIRRLRDEGQSVEAARELAAFRTTHADHEKLLPPDLRDWHPTEK